MTRFATIPAMSTARPAPYIPHAETGCPDCGGHHWHVGRVTAQCAACDGALPLADPRIRVLHH